MRSSVRARIALSGGMLAACAAGLPAAVAGQLNRPEVADVRFEGNRTFPADSLARAIVTRKTECRSWIFQAIPFCELGAGFALNKNYFQRREFPLDKIRLERWYYIRGFREASVDTATTTVDDGRIDVTFRINEGKPVLIDSLAVTGAEDLQGTDLLRDLPVRVGDPLNGLLLDATRDTLIRRLADRGYAQGDVLRNSFIPNSDSLTARVTYIVAPGPLTHYGHVSIEGNENLSESTVLRTLQFRSGDLYRLNQLEEAQARLFGLEIVQSARLEPDYQNQPDSIVPVHVVIREGNAHRVRAGAGWSDSECFDAEARWVSRNFMGGGRRLQVRGRLSNILADRDLQQLLCWATSNDPVYRQLNWVASVDFSQPWIFSTRNSFQASLYGEHSSLKDVYVRQAIGARIGLTRNVGPRTPLTLSYRPERSKLTAAEVLFCTNFLLCTAQDISTLENYLWLSPVGLTFTRSTTDNVLNPTQGYQALIDLEHADSFTGSDFTYSRVVMDGSTYQRMTDRVVLAARLRLGWVGAGTFNQVLGSQKDVAIVNPQRRFYAGGANSVRGFAQNRLGPRVLQVTDVNALLAPADSGGAGCTAEEVNNSTCDASPLSSDQFIPRPTGGTRVIEGSLELRIPLGSKFEGAAFTDFGQVWAAEDVVSLRDLEVTPGAGLRYMSPIGPLRMDLAYRFRGGEYLPVVTSGAPPREGDLVVLDQPVFYGSTSTWSLSRFQLHLSIGQAF